MYLENKIENMGIIDIAGKICIASEFRGVGIYLVPLDEHEHLNNLACVNPGLFHEKMLKYRKVDPSDLYNSGLPVEYLMKLLEETKQQSAGSTILLPLMESKSSAEFKAKKALRNFHSRAKREELNEREKRVIAESLGEQVTMLRKNIDKIYSGTPLTNIPPVPEIPKTNIPKTNINPHKIVQRIKSEGGILLREFVIEPRPEDYVQIEEEE